MSFNSSCSLLILFSLLLFLNLDLIVSKSCVRKCGGIDIPFPFGIGKGCYLEKWYEIECVNSSNSRMPKPFLSVIRKQVVNISLPSELEYIHAQTAGSQTYGSVYIRNPITSKGCSKDEEKSISDLNLTGTPFYVTNNNMLMAFGCNNTASLTNVKPNMMGCTSICGVLNNRSASEDYFATINCNEQLNGIQICDNVLETSSNGIRYCSASMPKGFQQIVGVKIEDSNTTTEGCKVAFLTDQFYDKFESLSPEDLHDQQYSTIKLGWFIQTTNLSFIDSLGCQNLRGLNSYMDLDDPKKGCVCDYRGNLGYANCACKRGYIGSPYDHECKDINECKLNKHSCARGRACVNSLGSYHCVYPKIRIIAIVIGAVLGSLILIGGIYWLYKFIMKQKRLYQKKKFFKRNGGLLLQQQLTSTQGKIEKTRLFSSKELEKATENFSLDRILGQGGQGTVYKGMLIDGRIVAIKKSKVVEEDKLEEFINEVVILSQINHRNIVKLLGCCLETNVPILVYEFIPNGNLFEHLQDEFDDDTMVTWEVRLRMAIDVAGALSYLHSAASSPIYHRDVKSTNIMLDEKFRAKVSDFGTSRSVTVDHTHLTTVVSGTMGYMDPEYFQSSQFTDKSDVYSFGVVLAELITGEKSISFMRSQENRTLATYFTLTMKENKLFDIIDPRIRDDCKLEQVTSTARIARRCLSMKGKKRPTMKEVSMQLERIRSSLGDMRPHDYISDNEEEKEKQVVALNNIATSWDNVVVTAPTSEYYVAASSSSYSDARPLFPLHTK